MEDEKLNNPEGTGEANNPVGTEVKEKELEFLGQKTTLSAAEKMHKELQGKYTKETQERSRWETQRKEVEPLLPFLNLLRTDPRKAVQAMRSNPAFKDAFEDAKDKAEEITGEKWEDLNDEQQFKYLNELLSVKKSVPNLEKRIKLIEDLIKNFGERTKLTQAEAQLEKDIESQVKRLKLDADDLKDDRAFFEEKFLAVLEFVDDDNVNLEELANKVYERISKFTQSKIDKYVNGKKGKDGALETGHGALPAQTKKKGALSEEEISRKIDEMLPA